MHLVYKVLDNYPLPITLPPELLPPSSDAPNRRGSTLVGAVQVLPSSVTPPEIIKVKQKENICFIAEFFLINQLFYHF